MRIFFAALFATFANSAIAQQYDLTTIPDDYFFRSIGNEGVTTIVNQGVEDGYFVFEQLTVFTDNSTWRTTIYLNRQSQTVISDPGEQGRRVYTPHDCAPSLGECANTFEQNGITYAERRNTILIGDVFFAKVYLKIGGEWALISKSCSTFDEYGFWIDYYMVFDDNTELWGYRETPRSADDWQERINRLQRICVPPELVS